jgi:4-cresol dehydrogenase (hydroxylating)
MARLGRCGPRIVEEVRAIVRIANEYKVPLWPVARGKNRLWHRRAAHGRVGGAGHGADEPHPRTGPQLAYAVVEPGVGFFDLHDEVERQKAPLWLSVPGNGWGSVIGNALEHGIGYTPYGLHARNLCGIEAVLPDGDLCAPAWAR